MHILKWFFRAFFLIKFSTFTMHQIVFKWAFPDVTTLKYKFACSLFLIINPVTFVYTSLLRKCQGTLTFFLTIFISTNIFTAITPSKNSIAFFDIILKITFILIPIFILVSCLSLSLTIDPVTHVFITILHGVGTVPFLIPVFQITDVAITSFFPGKSPIAFGFIIYIITNIYISIGPGIGAVSILFIFFPVSKVLVTALPNLGSAT